MAQSVLITFRFVQLGNQTKNLPSLTMSNTTAPSPVVSSLQPASKQLYDDETTSSVFGLRSATDPSPSPSPSPCGSERPPLGWGSSSTATSSAAAGPPVAEKPRWHLGRRAPAHFIPLDITGTTALKLQTHIPL